MSKGCMNQAIQWFHGLLKNANYALQQYCVDVTLQVVKFSNECTAIVIKFRSTIWSNTPSTPFLKLTSTATKLLLAKYALSETNVSGDQGAIAFVKAAVLPQLMIIRSSCNQFLASFHGTRQSKY